MPPPKKPKTGFTRVEEYLTEKDLEELKQKAHTESGMTSSEESDCRESESPVSSTQDILHHHQHGIRNKENDISQKYDIDSSSTRNGYCTGTKFPLKELENNENAGVKCESQFEVYEPCDKAQELNGDNKMYGSDDNLIKLEKNDNHDIKSHTNEHMHIDSYTTNKPEPSCDLMRDSERSVQKDEVLNDEHWRNRSLTPDEHYKIYNQTQFPKTGGSVILGSNSDSEIKDPPKMRKLESLMMRRQVDSLMDVLHPILPIGKASPKEFPLESNDPVSSTKISETKSPTNENFAINLSTKDVNICNDKANKVNSYNEVRKQDSFLTKTMENFRHAESHHKNNNTYSSLIDFMSINKKYQPNPEVSKMFKNKRQEGISPISSLQKMLAPDFNNFSQNNHLSAQTAGMLRLPFMYQHKLPFTNLHDLCPENNKNPNLATKPQPFLNSAQNINIERATRPSILHNGKPFLPINDIKKTSQQHCGLDVNQLNKTHTTEKQQELTSSELYNKYMKLALMKEGVHNDSIRALYLHSKENEYHRLPPLIPINSMVSSSTIPYKAYREPMDPGYGETNCNGPNQNISNEKKDNEHERYKDEKSPTSLQKSNHESSNRQMSNMYSNRNSISPNQQMHSSSVVTTTSAGHKDYHHHQDYMSRYSGAGSNCSVVSNSSENNVSSLPHSSSGPLSLGSVERSSHFTSLSQISSPTKTRGEELSPTYNHHLPSPLEMPTSTVEDKRRKTLEDRVQGRRCQICNDCASGFHYGVWSCEGCKAFFKRSLQGPVDYVCPSTNTCTIDKQRRKSCQACRLRKCVEMGMSRGNCRKERKSSGPRGPKRKSEGSDMEPFGPSDIKIKRADSSHGSPVNNMSETMKMDMSIPLSISTIAHSTTARMSPSSSGAPFTPPGTSSANTPYSVPHTPTESSPHQLGSSNGQYEYDTDSSPGAANQTSQISTSQPPIHPLAEHLIRIDPPMRSSGHDNSKLDSEGHLMTSLMRLSDLELVDVINWAKSIPGYTDLELKDRIHLLEVCWMEVLIVGVLWHSLQSPDTDQLHFATDLALDRNRLDLANLTSLGNGLLSCLKEFASLHINHEEFVLFRSLVLLNSDLSETASSTKISTLRNQILDALHYTVIERYHGSLNKVLSILTLLPHTRQLSIHWVGNLVSCSSSQHLSMYALLKEMVDAHISGTEHHYRHQSQSPGNVSSMEPLRNNFHNGYPPEHLLSQPIPSPTVGMTIGHSNEMYMRRDSYENRVSPM